MSRMFEIGRTYRVNVKSGRSVRCLGWETWMNCKVLEEKGPVVKFTGAGRSASSTPNLPKVGEGLADIFELFLDERR